MGRHTVCTFEVILFPGAVCNKDRKNQVFSKFRERNLFLLVKLITDKTPYIFL